MQRLTQLQRQPDTGEMQCTWYRWHRRSGNEAGQRRSKGGNMAKAEPRGRIPQLYREMQVGERVLVNIERQRAFHLLRSAWKRHHRREHIADGYDVPWLYLEPRGTNRTLIVRMTSEENVKAARAAYLKAQG